MAFTVDERLKREVLGCTKSDSGPPSAAAGAVGLVPPLQSPFRSPTARSWSYRSASSFAQDHHHHGSLALVGTPEISVADCFREFNKLERLEGDDQWYCSRCKEFRPASKQMSLWKLPNILVVHLKRFCQEGRHLRSKLQSIVHFPWKSTEELDVREFLLDGSPEERTCYKLFAIINHAGRLGSGHYEATVKCYFAPQPSEENQLSSSSFKWFRFSDTIVNPVRDDDRYSEEEEETIPEEHFVNESAYVLFYERMGAEFYR